MKNNIQSITLALLLFTIPFTTLAAKRKYFDYNGNKCKMTSAYTYREVTKQENGTYLVKYYYNENDQVSMEGVFTHKKLYNSSRKGHFTYFYKNGQKKSEGDYFKGNNDGEWTFWYSNGQVKSQGKYDKDNKEGIWEYYSREGGLKAKLNYTNGELDGDYSWTNEMGIKIAEGKYTNGEKNGPWTFYYHTEQNKVSSKVNYLKDSLDGEAINYFRDGTISAKGKYSDNKKIETFEYYHHNGKPASQVVYQKDKFKSATYFDEDGNKLKKKVVEEDLEKGAEYPGDYDDLLKKIYEKVSERSDVFNARKNKFSYFYYFKLTIDYEGNVIHKEWVSPDSEDDSYDDIYSFKKYIDASTDDMPKFKPAKEYNRNVESSYYVFVPISFEK